MIRLTKQQILLLHRDIVEALGGSPKIRDEGLLESAICTPFQTFADAELSPSILKNIMRFAVSDRLSCLPDSFSSMRV